LHCKVKLRVQFAVVDGIDETVTERESTVLILWNDVSFYEMLVLRLFSKLLTVLLRR